jgi:transcriptional regulator with XRE-family HTH domain
MDHYSMQGPGRKGYAMVASVTVPAKDRFKQLREAAGMSQEKLARKAGVSTSLIVQLESGRIDDPRVSTLRRVAEALGLRLEDVADEFGREAEASAEQPKKSHRKKRK